MYRNLNIQWKMIALFTSVGLILLTGLGLVTYFQTRKVVLEKIEQQLFSEAQTHAQVINSAVARINQLPRNIASAEIVSLENPDHDTLVRDYLRQVLLSDSMIINAYSANTLPGDQLMETSFLGWKYDGIERNEISMMRPNVDGDIRFDDDSEKFTFKITESAYSWTMERDQVSWSQPYYDDNGKDLIISAASPILVNGEMKGFSGVDLSLDILTNYLKTIEFGETGYAVIVDKNMNYVAHPSNQMAVEEQQNIKELAESNKIEGILTGINKILDGETINEKIEGINPLTGNEDWTVFVPIEETGWWFVMTVTVEELLGEVRNQVFISLVGSIATLLILALAAIFIARSISNPLSILTERAIRFSEGDVSLNESDRQKTQKILSHMDELGKVGRSFGQIIQYLNEISEVANRLANFDLTVEITPKSEKDKLGNALKMMVEKFRDVVGVVAENANGVNTASKQFALAADQTSEATNQIAVAIQEIASGTQNQTSSITTTLGSVENMSQVIESVAKGAQEQAEAVNQASIYTSKLSETIKQVSEGAQSVTRDSSSASEAAKIGAVVVEKTIIGMEEIRDKVNLSAQKVQEMGVRSNEIGTIVDAIEDIAGQTNLLALNAAIEAARAGEHGKGFSVVADEVRKLAERSTSATKEIGDLIKGIQNSVSDVVSTMEIGTQEVESGVARAREAGDVLETILKASEAVDQQAGQTGALVIEMSSAAGEMVNAINSVSAIVEENTAASEEMAASSNELMQSFTSIAAVSEENSASVEEVSATTEEMSSQVQEVAESADRLAVMAEDLLALTSGFKLSNQENLSEKIKQFEQAHQRWVDRAEQLMAGTANIQEEEVPSQNSCILGRWYFSSGMNDFGNLKEYQAVDKPHKLFHQALKKLVSAHNNGDSNQMEAYFLELTGLSKEIMMRLNKFEQAIKISHS
ncbi:MAG: CZB domain-containing protein [Anaerolineaceae bacterium]|nr:CZB domain-containing protein [Anaerolineaceae bacterium]